MSRKITIWKDPYDGGFDISIRRNIEINEGVTIIIGCNGLGKSTFISNIKSELKKEKIPFLSYNNLTDGGKRGNGNIIAMANNWMSSEGENITNNLGNKLLSHAREYINTGKPPKDDNPFNFLRKEREKEDEPVSDERWILLDAVDSGYSIDNIIHLKEIFDLMINDAINKDVKLYIVASANEYELASGMPCFDLAKGKYVEVNSYEEYKNIILKSRYYKDNTRYNKYKSK